MVKKLTFGDDVLNLVIKNYFNLQKLQLVTNLSLLYHVIKLKSRREILNVGRNFAFQEYRNYKYRLVCPIDRISGPEF